MHLAILVECQSRNLLGMAKPVPLGTRMQVLHHHQSTTCVGKEACRQGKCQCLCHCWQSDHMEPWHNKDMCQCPAL